MHLQVPSAMSFILCKESIGEVCVLILASLVAIAAVVILKLHLSFSALRKVFIVATIVCFAAMAAVAVIGLEPYGNLIREHGPVEWLTADFLLAACILAVIATVRAMRSDRPMPVGLFLAYGCFVAFYRELEWGAPFTGGERLWRRRHLVNPRAYWDVSYFEKYSRKLDAQHTPQTLYTVHLITVGVLVLLGAIAVVYIIRQRRTFIEQLRKLPVTVYGRYFLLGLGGYIGAHVVGKIIHWIHETMNVTGFAHRLLEEPFELWGAMAFFFSMLALWSAVGDNSLEEQRSLDGN
ncbi:MAG: hypothetical protein SVV80_02790 [Planctomycetota bacterium]|nr:hypothetical protein [Planctomycetota bacterium]